MNRQALGRPPRILLIATTRWPLTARLASGFLSLGSRVAAVCPVPGHPVTKVRGFEHLYRYAGRHPLESLRAGIDDFSPDFVVPLCDRSVQHLHALHTETNADTECARRRRHLIERSLGPSSSYPIVSSRYDLLMLAKGANIRIPHTVRIDSKQDLQHLTVPLVLKASGTWGGRGVRRADTPASAEKAFHELTSGMTALRLVKQVMLNRDRDWTIATWHDERPGIIAQAMVPGRPANCTAVCWQGELLAGIAVEVIEADGPLQPAIMVQVVEGREMLDAAKQIARRLNLTGFFGLDFMIEDRTGDLYLIEMNPRCTPPCSLNLGKERDLVAAVWAQLTGQPMPQRESVTESTRIAYFPQASRNSDLSEAVQLGSAYLDVPVGEPRLAEVMLHPWSERALLGKLFDTFRGKLRRDADKRLNRCVFRVSQDQTAAVPESEVPAVMELPL